MKHLTLTLTTAIAVAAFTPAAFAQDAAFELPDVCTQSLDTTDMDHANMDHDQGSHAGSMDHGRVDLSDYPEHVQENMRKMNITMPAMEKGMMNEDPDVAFACGMIAHHQGAIDMAGVLLEHGDDPEMLKLAEDIMAAQVGEIEQMENWLAENVD